MMRKPTLLAAMLVVLVWAMSPALAQGDSVVASGMIEKPEVTAYQYGTHAITDEASGTRYALQSDIEWLLDGYVGQQVIIYGTVVPGYEAGQVESGPALVDVYRVETADLIITDCANPSGCEGTGGRDRTFGTGGKDFVHGYGDDDVLYGMEGKDELRGGAGNDVLYGDAGKDKLQGGKGDDAIHADDGTKDQISCGSGNDTVIADANDRVASDCETVTRPDELEGGVLATFEDYGQRFRVWVTNPETIRNFYQRQNSEDRTKISGWLLRDSGQGNHNAPYGWHLDPRDVTTAEVTVPECEASPSYVEENYDAFVENTGGHFCPSGKLMDLRNYTGEEIAPAP